MQFLIGIVIFSLGWGIVNAQVGCNTETVYFRNGKYKANKQIREQIEQLAMKWSPDSVYALEVSGYTDSRNSEAYNIELGGRRIRTVVSLIRHNRAHGLIISEYNHGEQQAGSDVDQKDRRVEIRYRAINKDSTITVRGEHGETITIPYSDLGGSSKCDCRLYFKLRRGSGQDSFSSMRFWSECGEFEQCLHAVIRIPFDHFPENKFRSEPGRLVFNYCWGTKTVGGEPDETTAHDYKVTMDYVVKEYVVSTSCYGPKQGPCCGTLFCAPYDWVFYIPRSEAGEVYDSVRLNSNYVSRDMDAIYAIDLSESEQYLYQIYQDSVKGRVRTEYISTDSCIGRVTLVWQGFERVKLYSHRDMMIKMSRRIRADSVGVKIKRGGFILPLIHDGKREFAGMKPTPGFYFVLYVNGQPIIWKKQWLKKKVSRKNKVLQYKLSYRQFKKHLNRD